MCVCVCVCVCVSFVIWVHRMGDGTPPAGLWKTSSSEMKLKKTDFAGESTRGDKELPSGL